MLEIKKVCKEEKNGDKIEYIINKLTNSEYYLKNKKITEKVNKNNNSEKTECFSYSQNNDENHSNIVNKEQKSYEKEQNDNNQSNNFFNSVNNYRKQFDEKNDFLTKNETKDEIKNNLSFYMNIEIFKNTAKSLLQKSRIIIKINKSEFNLKIYLGDNFNETIDNLYQNEDYDKYIESKKSNEDSKIIFKNYKRFLTFLKEIIEYLNRAKIKFNPKIILELKRQNSNVNKTSQEKEHQDIYDIDCK